MIVIYKVKYIVKHVLGVLNLELVDEVPLKIIRLMSCLLGTTDSRLS